MATKKGATLLTIPDEAANVELAPDRKKLSYTKENNLYVANLKSPSLAVTNHTDKNIVSGQAIARYEFGIRKGTFWSPKGNYLAFYEKDETDVADYPLLDISTTPGKLFTTKYPMAGQKSEYGKVGIYNTKTKSTIYLIVDGPKDQYLTNLAWDPNEQFVYIAVVLSLIHI